MDFETIEQDRKTKNVNIFTAFIKEFPYVSCFFYSLAHNHRGKLNTITKAAVFPK